MESYIIKDILGVLPELLGESSNNDIGILGHSMGGHGALTLGLKYSTLFSSISAFSPILNPVNCPWGEKAFTGYLGEDKKLWKNHDFIELLKLNETHQPIRIDQGLDDEFLDQQLGLKMFEKFQHDNLDEGIDLYKHEGFDHSYYFISSFIKDHIMFHLAN